MAERREKVVPISKRLRLKRERRRQVRAIANWFRVPVEAIQDAESRRAAAPLGSLQFLQEVMTP